MGKVVAYFKFLSHQLLGRSQEEQEEIRYFVHRAASRHEGARRRHTSVFGDLV